MEDNLTPEIVRPMWARELLSGRRKQRPHRLCTMQVKENGEWRDATDAENEAISAGKFAGETQMLNCQLGVLWITINQALADDPEDGVPADSCFEWVPGVGWCAEDSAIFPPVWAMRAAGLGMVDAEATASGAEPFAAAEIACEREWEAMSGVAEVTVANCEPFDDAADKLDPIAREIVMGHTREQVLAGVEMASGCEPFDEIAWLNAPFQPLPPEKREAMVANAGVTPFCEVAEEIDPLFDPTPGQPVLRLTPEDRRLCDGAGRLTAGIEPFSDVAAMHLRHVALIDGARVP